MRRGFDAAPGSDSGASASDGSTNGSAERAAADAAADSVALVDGAKDGPRTADTAVSEAGGTADIPAFGTCAGGTESCVPDPIGYVCRLDCQATSGETLRVECVALTVYCLCYVGTTQIGSCFKSKPVPGDECFTCEEAARLCCGFR